MKKNKVVKKAVKVRKPNPDKIHIKSAEDFENIRKKLIFNKRNFKVVSSGSVSRILYMGKEFIKMDVKQFKGKGFHISVMFRRGVDEWLKTHKNTLKPHVKDYKEQMFCLGHIDEVIGKPLVMIDISGCYWQTAYKLGYMTRELYIAGRRKKEWKTGRNAAIGGLCKRETITPYHEGDILREKRITRQPPPEYGHIRNHIIGHVYRLFYRLYSEVLGRKFFMFLTDAVVTTPDMVNEVKKTFAAEGYSCTQKTIEFTKLDRKNKTVFWFDFTAPIEEVDSKGNVKIVGYGKEKYYQYSYAQVVPDFISETFVELDTKMDGIYGDGFCSSGCQLHYAKTGEINECCEKEILVNKSTGEDLKVSQDLVHAFKDYLYGQINDTERPKVKDVSKHFLKTQILLQCPNLGSVNFREPYTQRELNGILRVLHGV